MKARNSNIELLRLLCIVMIISMHVFGLFKDHLDITDYAALSFNNAICNLGVSIFMLISGYYGIRYKTEKLLSLWNIALFWSLALIFVDTDHSAKHLIRSVFPVFTNKYWFLTSSVIIFCLAPYIEKLISVITQQQFRRLIVIMLLFFVIAPSFLMLEIMRDSGKGVMNMLTVYLLGRYCSIYGLPKRLSGVSGGGVLFIVIMVITVMDLAVTLKAGTLFQMLARDNCILILLGAITVFTIVMKLKPHTMGWLNHLASYVFPVYVIHGALLTRLVYVPENTYSILYLMVWANTITITMTAIVMESVRRMFLNKPFLWLLGQELKAVETVKKKIHTPHQEFNASTGSTLPND